MKRLYRLLKSEDFKNVLDKKQYVSRENFVIYHKMNNLEHCRVGVSVSSKIGNSVVRHKIKRQIINMVDQTVEKSFNCDIVIIARKKFLEYSFKENYDVFKKAIFKIINKGE